MKKVHYYKQVGKNIFQTSWYYYQLSPSLVGLSRAETWRLHNLWLVYLGNGLALCLWWPSIKWLEWFEHEHSNDGNDVDTVVIPILWIVPFFFLVLFFFYSLKKDHYLLRL